MTSTTTSALTGFDPAEIAGFLAEPTEGLTDPDLVPEVPDEPISKPGDLYLLGKHRLLCGDATSADDVERLMAGKRATLMATDPPYLVDYQGGQHPASEANQGAASKDKHWDAYIDHAHSRRVLRRLPAHAPSTAPSTTTPPSTSGSGSCAPR